MTYPVSSYIDEREDNLYIAESRVSLDSVIIRFQMGASPEKIIQSFPTLELSQVYGAIAYYLENEASIREYVAQNERELERAAVPLSHSDPALFARLETWPSRP